MSRLIEAWEQLLREATDPDYDEMQDAMFKIALVLERHNYPKKMSTDLYEEHLSRDLLRLTLDDKRQQEAVDFLVAMVKARPQDADSFFYGLSKCKASYALEPLLRLIREQGTKWNQEGAYEAVVALDQCLKLADEAMVAILKANDPSDQLDIWAEHPEEDLADRADWVLEKVETLLGKEA